MKQGVLDIPRAESYLVLHKQIREIVYFGVASFLLLREVARLTMEVVHEVAEQRYFHVSAGSLFFAYLSLGFFLLGRKHGRERDFIVE